MQVEFEQRFFAPLPEVASAYADPHLLERLAAAQSICRTELLERIDDGDIVQQRVRFTFTGALPPAVTALINPTRLTWVEESTLDRSTHHRRFTVVPDHYVDRLSCSGTVELHSGEAITTRHTCALLEVRIPVFAAQVAKAIAAGLRDYAATEAGVVQQWLDERGVRTSAPRASRPPAATRGATDVARAYSEQWHEVLRGIQDLGERAGHAAGSAGRNAGDAAEQFVAAWARWWRDS